MSNYWNFGPVVIRVGSKHLAPWGFPRLRVHGLSIWTWDNDGRMTIASYHPKSSITWLWAVKVDPWRPWRWKIYRQDRMPRKKSNKRG